MRIGSDALEDQEGPSPHDEQDEESPDYLQESLHAHGMSPRVNARRAVRIRTVRTWM